jgi:hypothetical protein
MCQDNIEDKSGRDIYVSRQQWRQIREGYLCVKTTMKTNQGGISIYPSLICLHCCLDTYHIHSVTYCRYLSDAIVNISVCYCRYLLVFMLCILCNVLSLPVQFRVSTIFRLSFEVISYMLEYFLILRCGTLQGICIVYWCKPLTTTNIFTFLKITGMHYLRDIK